MSGKFVGGALAVTAFSLAAVGIYSMTTDLASSFNTASLSEGTASILKLGGGIAGAVVGFAGGGYAGSKTDIELKGLRNALALGAVCAIGAAYGGYKITGNIVDPLIEKQKPAHALILPSDQIPAAHIPAQFKIT